MPTPRNPQRHGPPSKENPSTYFVQDRENRKELERLTIQDRMLTASMGGPLPEQADAASLRRVLDIGSGSGNWVIEAAQRYPTMSLIGIDISARMVEYARTQAQAAHVDERVAFHVMDALRGLEFPDASFDLVNLRLGVSFVRTWEWPDLLAEMLRLTRPQGLIRLTDQEMLHLYAGPAYRRCNEIFLCAFFRAGYLFEQEATGITAHLAPLLERFGCRQVQTKLYTLEYRAGTPEGQAYYENMVHVFQTARPFLQKWGCMMGVDEAIFEQALEEMRQPDFHTAWRFLTAWGNK